MEYMVWVWLGIIIITGILEAVTSDFVSVWFTAGGIVALIIAAINQNTIVIQLVCFFAVSLVLLILSRPFTKKYIKRNEIKMNVEAIVGKVGLITKEVTDILPGEVKVDGQLWTAISSDHLIEDDKVEILAVEGVKLIVKKVIK